MNSFSSYFLIGPDWSRTLVTVESIMSIKTKSACTNFEKNVPKLRNWFL